MNRRGRFIVVEGADGAGKSTQSQLLADHLDAVLTREPGGTAIGEEMRHIFLHADLSPRAEALLVAAARAQHVAEVVEPTLASGRHIVCDRYVLSSLAYQGVGRELGIDDVAALSTFATAGLCADLTVILDVPDEVNDARRSTGADRFEEAESGFHQRVRAAYRALADRDPTWVIVDGVGAAADVHRRIAGVVSGRLALP